MRIVSSFDKEQTARRFSLFLQKQGIENTIDIELDVETKNFFYQIWVIEEEKVPLAKEFLEEFNKNPKDSKFDVSIKEILPQQSEQSEIKPLSQIKASRYHYKITSAILFLCIFVYLINYYQEMRIRKSNPKLSYVLLTPIQQILLFDVPSVIIKLDEVIKKYQIDPNKDIKEQSIEAVNEINQINSMPFWRGFYEMLLLKKGEEKTDKVPSGPIFIKIREGQFWRLFSPCILHKELLHLLFNMLWLWLLSKQIEQRLSRPKFILLILLIGIISNIAQYLMSGPYFLGFSGVIMGMVGFIWSRQKVAPWEGYPLQKTVFLFLGVYVVLMFVLSFFSFITEVIGLNLFTPNIANTAHITGAIAGWILGRFSFFSWRVHHER